MIKPDRRIRGPLVLPALFVLLSLSCAAGAAQPKPLTGDPQAEAAMQRMRHQLAAATTLNFTCACTIPTTGSAGMGGQLSPLVVSGTVQKPGDIFLTFTHNDMPIGLLSVDGSTEYFFDARNRRYVKGDLVRGPNLSDEAAGGGTLIKGSTTSILNTALAALSDVQAYQMFFRGKDPLSQPSAWFQKQSSNPTGKLDTEPLSLPIVYKNAPDTHVQGKLTRHILGDIAFQAVQGEPPISQTETEDYLDKNTGLPVLCVDYGAGSFSPAIRSEQSYSQIDLSNKPAPPSTFDWSPPPGAIAARE